MDNRESFLIVAAFLSIGAAVALMLRIRDPRVVRIGFFIGILIWCVAAFYPLR